MCFLIDHFQIDIISAHLLDDSYIEKVAVAKNYNNNNQKQYMYYHHLSLFLSMTW